LIKLGQRHQITFTRARPANNNDGCRAEQKNWAAVRTVVGYHRYDTAAELLLLNEIWQLQSELTNYFYPQQKLISKVGNGAKVSKKHDIAATAFHRSINHATMTVERMVALTRSHALINPAVAKLCSGAGLTPKHRESDTVVRRGHHQTRLQTGPVGRDRGRAASSEHGQDRGR
jgi:hypothetical protein